MKRAIVTGGTKSDVAAMAVFAINIRNTNANLFDKLVILHDGVDEKSKRLIEDIYDTEFILYKYPHKSKNDEVVNNFSEMVFCKYECFRLLAEYDVVVWSDYDVVIKGSLEEMCQFDGQVFNIVDSATSIRSMFYKEITSLEVGKYDLNQMGIATPIFALSNKLTHHGEIYKWCYEKTDEWDADLYLPEQCIFGLIPQVFDVPLKRFSSWKYVRLPKDVTGDELIIHAAGHPKFWEGLHNDIWEKMYCEWIEMGGSRYNHRAKQRSKKVRFFLSRLFGMRGKEKIT